MIRHVLIFSLCCFKTTLCRFCDIHAERERRRRREIEEMGAVACESESWVGFTGSIHENLEIEDLENRQWSVEGEEQWPRMRSNSLGKKKKNQVLLEGYVEAADKDLTRTKSLTDEDLDELKGCLDLGFGFSYDEIPELCNTLPALELCYSMSQKFMDEHQRLPEKSPDNLTESASTADSPSNSIANWKISSPGEFLLFFSE